MTDKPLCPVCNVSHHLSSPHIFPYDESAPIAKEAWDNLKPKKAVTEIKAKPPAEGCPKCLARVVYQRELMKKRRAEGKA